MPPALTPALALDYVRELSADVRVALLLDAGLGLLAGPQPLAGPARRFAEACGAAAEVEVVGAQGAVCAVRTTARTIVAVCGPFAIPGVVRSDLRAALGALAGTPPVPGEARPPDPADAALERAAEALISAAQRQFWA
jgi:hypothetical protein